MRNAISDEKGRKGKVRKKMNIQYFEQEKLFKLDTPKTSYVFGIAGKRVAVIGENSYYWAVTYLAVVMGGGVIIPLDKELAPGEIENFIRESEAEGVVFADKYLVGIFLRIIPISIRAVAAAVITAQSISPAYETPFLSR